MSRKCDIRDNALSDNSALFMGVDEFLVVISMFFGLSGWHLLQEIYN